MQLLDPNVASLAAFAIYLWRNPREAHVFPIALASRRHTMFHARNGRGKHSFVEDGLEHGKTLIAKVKH
jgi:hypothetical protein